MQLDPPCQQPPRCDCSARRTPRRRDLDPRPQLSQLAPNRRPTKQQMLPARCADLYSTHKDVGRLVVDF
eukprot:11615011-Prorocentrum_lima.AAC.1